MSAPIAPRRLFAYGTLELPEVMEALLGRGLPQRSARLEGFERRLVRDRPYPGIVPRAEACVAGVLYDGLEADALARLDHFEGSLYERREVRVRVARAGALPAWTYVLREAHHLRLSDEPWDADRFRALHLDEYVAFGAELSRSWRAGIR